MAGDGSIVFTIFLIFTGAAILASLALFARQSLLVAYILLGGLLGPWGLKLVADAQLITQIGNTGIIFLLFLLGLNLHPQKLVQLLREAAFVTLASSAVFWLAGWGIARVFGFQGVEAWLVGAVMVFSSTIVGLKLMPATALHHRHMGEVMISILLLQDILAIALLLFVQGLGHDTAPGPELARLALALPALVLGAWLAQRWILLPLMRRFDTIQEFLFLAALGWCLGLAQLAHTLGLSYEIGAFVGGVALASQAVARFIAERLRPLRDFFLIMFFFALGAGLELPTLREVMLPALALAAAALIVKPLVFSVLFRLSGEKGAFSREMGMRLGQLSEFSLLIAVVAAQVGVTGARASNLVQAATIQIGRAHV